MKGKNSAFYNGPRDFFEKEFSSLREYVVLCFLSLIIELGNRIFLFQSLEQEKLAGWQDTPLFLFLCVLWKVSVVCVVALIPIMLIVCIILWHLLKKNTRKLNEINRQQGEIACHQKHRYKKGDRVKIDDILVMVFGFVLLLVTLRIACVPITIVELYYGVFKQARKYYCLKQQLKSV
ncbi:hypothetical protein [Bartonella tribocorum]|uniref:Uncharacterized protein n=1 Tax=Bartonella tribocorum TaxID=85701 RepID=A0A2N9Y8V5_9HYPH|nr:hypothetical protein [Bartonella tribocorum]PIT68138.1 hypothetical protein CER18_08260 [Bartonella tribocorum]